MDKILELLGINKLDESTQTELKEKLQDIIEVKAKELSETSLEEQKTKILEEYEAKFDEYKDDITSKFSNFVDSVLEEEMTIPEEVMEYAKKGQLYNDLIEQFKIRLGVDQGLLDEEVKSLLKEAKEEIVKLRGDMDKQIAENLEVRKDAQELAATVYLYQKCEGLTEAQRQHVFTVLEGIFDKAEIDRKFDILKESDRFEPVAVSSTENPDDAAEKIRNKNKKTSDPKNNEDQVEEQNNGNGKAEVEDEDEDEDEEEKKKKKMEEQNSPFSEYKNRYLKVLQENKIG